MRRLHPACIECLIHSKLTSVPEETSEERKAEYMQAVLRLLGEAPKEYAAPLLAREIEKLQKEMFGCEEDFTAIKKHFNHLMLKLETEIDEQVESADDPIKLAMQYAMVGNYIDFGAMYKVDETYLKEFLRCVSEKEFDPTLFEMMKKELSAAQKMVYITDNCGEIVADKILIRQLQKYYPNLDITVIVRGAPASNDATIEDAQQVGLTEMVRVIGNGSDLAGTWMDELSNDAKSRIEGADLILAKGQANYETLSGLGLNIYHLFLCKCPLFSHRFDVPQFTGILINERQ